ncbi:MAG: RNA polymerase sigma factor [Pseudomonadota bacterium]
MADHSDDQDSFDAAYRSHFGRVKRLSQGFVGCGAMAEDVTHEAFIRWFSKLERNDGRAGQHIPLLYWIAKGLSIDTERRRRNTARLRHQLPEPALSAPSAECIYVAKEDARRIDDALSRMKAAKRDAFLLRRAEGMSFRRIADILRISTSRAHHLAVEAMLELDDVLNDDVTCE